mmetsp:Transcript_120114/g.335115  ORF Transcript_120114/g.335115 Transcript_120114/m.335115 type:complete len:260 (+) Transcript_120114:394-1173(+)
MGREGGPLDWDPAQAGIPHRRPRAAAEAGPQAASRVCRCLGCGRELLQLRGIGRVHDRGRRCDRADHADWVLRPLRPATPDRSLHTDLPPALLGRPGFLDLLIGSGCPGQPVPLRCLTGRVQVQWAGRRCLHLWCSPWCLGVPEQPGFRRGAADVHSGVLHAAAQGRPGPKQVLLVRPGAELRVHLRADLFLCHSGLPCVWADGVVECASEPQPGCVGPVDAGCHQRGLHDGLPEHVAPHGPAVDARRGLDAGPPWTLA